MSCCLRFVLLLIDTEEMFLLWSQCTRRKADTAFCECESRFFLGILSEGYGKPIPLLASVSRGSSSHIDWGLDLPVSVSRVTPALIYCSFGV